MFIYLNLIKKKIKNFYSILNIFIQIHLYSYLNNLFLKIITFYLNYKSIILNKTYIYTYNFYINITNFSFIFKHKTIQGNIIIDCSINNNINLIKKMIIEKKISNFS